MKLVSGLTCASCQQPLYPSLACITDDGYVHAKRCPRVCEIDGCNQSRHTALHCSSHHQRLKRYGDPLGGGTPRHAPIEIEDVEWMVETGEVLSGACRRLGKSVNTFERALARVGRSDLYRALAAREGRVTERAAV